MYLAAKIIRRLPGASLSTASTNSVFTKSTVCSPSSSQSSILLRTSNIEKRSFTVHHLNNKQPTSSLLHPTANTNVILATARRAAPLFLTPSSALSKYFTSIAEGAEGAEEDDEWDDDDFNESGTGLVSKEEESLSYHVNDPNDSLFIDPGGRFHFPINTAFKMLCRLLVCLFASIVF